MPTRSFDDIATKAKASWGPETHALHETLGSELAEEVSAHAALGRQLAELRTRHHLSQGQLAARASVQQSDISRIERGLGNPTTETLVRLASALDARLTLVSAG